MLPIINQIKTVLELKETREKNLKLSTHTHNLEQKLTKMTGELEFVKYEYNLYRNKIQDSYNSKVKTNKTKVYQLLSEEITRLESLLNYRDQLLKRSTNTIDAQSLKLKTPGETHVPTNNILEWLKNLIRTNREREKFLKDANEIKTKSYHAVKKVLENGTLIFEDETGKIHTPEFAKESDRHIQIGDRLVRTYKLEKLPTELSIGSLSALMQATLPLQITQFITSNSTGRLKVNLNQQIDKLRLLDFKATKSKGGFPDPSIRKELEEALTFQDAMMHDLEKGFGFSMYVSVEAESKDELLEKDKQLREIFDSTGFTYSVHSDGQKDAFRSTLPLNEDKVNAKKIFQTSAITRLLPFITRSHADKGGAFLGYSGSHPVFLNIFNRSMNSHVNIFGKSGSGKSVSAKLLTLRNYLLNELQVIIVDITPKGEYRELASALDGQVVSFNKNSGINLFPETSNYAEYVASLVTFLQFFIDPKKFDRDALEAALIRMYEGKGKKTLRKLIQELDEHRMNESLENLETGVLSGLFSGETDINLTKDFVLLDLTDPIINAPEYRPAFLFLSLALTKVMLQKIPQERAKLIIFDEAHLLQTNEETAKFHENLVKVGRHDNIGVISITQNVEDFLFKSKFGRAILTNPETTFLFRQNMKTIEELAGIYQLPDGVRESLAALGKGQCYLLSENEYIPLSFHVFESEKDYVKTGGKEVDAELHMEKGK